MTILVSRKLEPKIRGSLRKWMIEIDAGVFIGDLSKRVREEIMGWLKPQMKEGEATLIISEPKSQTGYRIETILKETHRETVELSGIPLVKRNLKKDPF